MMIDADLVWAAPSTVYKILCRAGAIRPRSNRSRHRAKGDGFEQPVKIHEHWHVDITYVRVGRKHCFLTTVIDGCSRYIIVSRLTETMKDDDIGIAVQIARANVFLTLIPASSVTMARSLLARSFKSSSDCMVLHT